MSDELVALLRRMVAIPSISPGYEETFERPYGEADMAEFVSDWCARNGLEVEKQPVRPQRENVLARVQGRSPATVVFCAHLDTVDVQGMTIAPFDPVIKDGQVWGRGSCDDKGSLAAMMMALKQIAARGRPEATLVLAATCGEEHSQCGAKAAAAALDHVRAVVVGEPTGLSVVRAHKGALRWRITTTGTRAHSSAPHLGVNAIYRMARVVSRIEAFNGVLAEQRRHPDLGPATVSVGTIHGGEEVNSVPGRCVIQVDRRLLPGEVGRDATRALQRHLAADPQIDFDVDIVSLSELGGMECGPDDPVVGLILACAQAQQPEAQVTTAAYGTDAASLSALGCPTPVIGPGDIADAHTVAEHIDIRQLQAGLEVYRTFAERAPEVIA